MRKIFIFFLTFLFLFSFSIKAGEIQGIKKVKHVKYDLPYPGILPDHPLYPLKKLRDKLTEFLKFSPQDKASFILLLSDKKISMARELSNKGKLKLALKTSLEAERDFKKLIKLTEKSKEVKNNPSFTSKMKLSHDKHSEVIWEIVAKSQLSEEAELVKKVYQALEENEKLLTRI